VELDGVDLKYVAPPLPPPDANASSRRPSFLNLFTPFSSPKPTNGGLLRDAPIFEITELIVYGENLTLSDRLTLLVELLNMGVFGSIKEETTSQTFSMIKARLLSRGNTPVTIPRDVDVTAEDLIKSAKDLSKSELGMNLRAVEGQWQFELEDVELKFTQGPLGIGVFMHKDYSPMVCITKVGGQAEVAKAKVGDQIVKVDGG
jgi:hypothetical protein